MKHRSLTMPVLLAAAGLACSVSGCTVKATLKTSTDAVTNVLSSTLGGSWLTEEGLVKQGEKVNAFAALNFDNLKQDMAQGKGEYLASFGTLLGVPREHERTFSTFARENYTLLIPSDRTTPGEMLTALAREMSADPRP